MIKKTKNPFYAFTLQTLLVSGAPVVIHFQTMSGYSVQEKQGDPCCQKRMKGK